MVMFGQTMSPVLWIGGSIGDVVRHNYAVSANVGGDDPTWSECSSSKDWKVSSRTDSPLNLVVMGPQLGVAFLWLAVFRVTSNRWLLLLMRRFSTILVVSKC